MRGRVPLARLDCSDYAHPLDAEALRTLKAIPGLALVVRKANEVGLDQIARLQSLANKVRVTERQFSRLYSLFEEARSTLGIQVPVELYVQQMYSLNAYTNGVEYPHVTVTTSLTSVLTDEELMFVLGHELGHVKSEHVLYRQIGYYLPMMIHVIGPSTLGIGNIIAMGLNAALYDWMRKGELTADRAGLLACQNPTAAQTALCKLAGVPDTMVGTFDIAELQAQVDEFNHLSKDASGVVIQHLVQMWDSHPWIAIRLTELRQWVDAGHFHSILERRGADSGLASLGAGSSAHQARRCPVCSQEYPPNSSYCIYCGAYLSEERS